MNFSFQMGKLSKCSIQEISGKDAMPLRPLNLFCVHVYAVFLQTSHCHQINKYFCWYSKCFRIKKKTPLTVKPCETSTELRPLNGPSTAPQRPLDGTQWKERFVERGRFQGAVQQLDQLFAQRRRRRRRSQRGLGRCRRFLAQLTLGDQLMDLPQVFQTAGATALKWRNGSEMCHCKTCWEKWHDISRHHCQNFRI